MKWQNITKFVFGVQSDIVSRCRENMAALDEVLVFATSSTQREIKGKIYIKYVYLT